MTLNFLKGFLAKSTLILTSFAFLFVVFSCQKEEEKIAPKQTNLEPLIQYLESTGFDRNEIVYNNGTFIIDNDILISKEEVEKYMTLPSSSSSSNQRTEHYRGYLVSNTYVTNIRYYIESSVPSAWRTAITNAVNQWNAINGTKLYLSVTTSTTNAHCRINTAYSAENWVARAYLPSYTGRPGHQMTINTRFNTMDSGRKLFTIVHEMGHTFGFYHTDQNQGTFIQGTPTRDANSVMNSTVLPWNGFTAGDVRAVQIIYPQ